MIPHLPLAQAPHQGRLDRVVAWGHINSSAVEPALHSEHIQSVHADGTHFWVGENLVGHRFCCFPWHHQFKPILATQSSPDASNLCRRFPLLEVEVDVGQKRHGRQRVGREWDVVCCLRSDLATAKDRLENTLGGRTLECEASLLHRLNPNIDTALAGVGDIHGEIIVHRFVRRAGGEHFDCVVFQAHESIIENQAVGVEDEGVADVANCHSHHITGQKMIADHMSVSSRHRKSSAEGHVDQPGLGADHPVLRQGAAATVGSGEGTGHYATVQLYELRVERPPQTA
mmetsp:Transcript_19846/g.45540  ORF Transcript_19846/g.45540 Transcript_19846/m.45540 type:complete len:286 (+) Transcript_19846:1076-1933(+)